MTETLIFLAGVGSGVCLYALGQAVAEMFVVAGEWDTRLDSPIGRFDSVGDLEDTIESTGSGSFDPSLLFAEEEE